MPSNDDEDEDDDVDEGVGDEEFERFPEVLLLLNFESISGF